MMTRRLSTPHESGGSVRFYKIITFVFLFVTVSLLGVIIFMTTKHATVVVVADEEAKNTQFAVKISSSGYDSQTVRGAVTTTTFFWSKTYHPVGTKTVEGTSRGRLTIHNDTDAPLTLIPKTRFITTEGVLFRLKNRTTISARGTTDAEVYADASGSASDIAPTQFSLPALPPDKQKVIYARSTEAMTGGASAVGILSEEDMRGAEADFKAKLAEAYA